MRKRLTFSINIRSRVWVVCLFVVLVTLLHYSTPLQKPFPHELFARFYYFPIFLGGIWFGLRGGLAVSIAVSLIYLPHVWMGWGKGGAIFWDKLLEVILFNIAGPTIGILADLEHRQRARNQELQILAAMGEAAGYVAHEMKNILIPIGGFIRRVRKACPMDGEIASCMEIIERNTARLETMAKDMLAFARQAPPQKERVEVDSLLQDVCAGLQGGFEEKGVQLICQCEKTAKAYMDSDRIRQALFNLLNNALHASPEGASVRISAQNDNQSLRILVEDEGEGIPEELHERVSLPFFTTKPDGTGLGLAITSRIAREHGGKITLESIQGKGTRVSMQIPHAHHIDGPEHVLGNL